MEAKEVVLVTGGSGYIGSVLVPRLLNSGYQVRVLDAGYFGHESLNTVKNRIELVESDIRSCSEDVFQKVTSVVHLAGFSNDPTAEYNPTQNFSVNFDGTRRIATLAKNAGVKRFIFGSTCSVYYSEQPDDSMRTESTLIYPKAPYSLSKHLAEQYLCAQRSDSFAPIILRKGTVYGLSPRMRYDLAVNTFVKNAYINKSLILHAGGWMWRPFVNIQDVAGAYEFLLRAPVEKTSGHTYNLVGFNTLIKDIATQIQSVAKQDFNVDLVLKSEETGPQRSYRVSGDKLGEAGFSPEAHLATAVNEMWRMLQSGAHDLGEAKYYNIRQFEYLFPREI